MSEVLTDISDGVIIITINRPEVRNAVNRAVAEKRSPVWSGS